MVDLSTWKYVCKWGYSYEIRAKGDKRILINQETKEIVFEYDIHD